MSTCKTPKSAQLCCIYLQDSNDPYDQKLIYSMRVFASIIRISQMQWAQCGFKKFVMKMGWIIFHNVNRTRIHGLLSSPKWCYQSLKGAIDISVGMVQRLNEFHTLAKSLGQFFYFNFMIHSFIDWFFKIKS